MKTETNFTDAYSGRPESSFIQHCTLYILILIILIIIIII